MADTKITALTAITTVDPAADVLPIVDVSDTSMAASGTTKKITSNQILGAGGTATLASATITGDLTVDTSTLKVDSANNYVGIGTASPVQSLTISGEASVRVNDLIYWNGYYNAGFKARATGYAAYIGEAASGDFVIANTASSAAGAGSSITFFDRYRISNSGVHTWEYVGGVAGTAMTLNANGLGIGVTPSAWGSNYKVVQVGQAGAVYGSAPTGFYGTKFNIYNDNTNDISITNNFVGEYRFNILNGSHIWFNKSTSSGGIGVNQTLTQAMTLDASGNLLVGTTAQSSNERLRVNNTASNGWAVTMTSTTRGWLNRQSDANGGIAAYFEVGSGNTNVGSINTTSSGTSFVTTSDYRLKENVQPLVGGLTRISALKPSIYKWKVDGSSGEGFLAHELAEVVPFAVTGDKDAVNEDGSIKPQGVDLSKVVPVLVAAIQELTARVQTLETR